VHIGQLTREQVATLAEDVRAKILSKADVIAQSEGKIEIEIYRQGRGFDIKIITTNKAAVDGSGSAKRPQRSWEGSCGASFMKVETRTGKRSIHHLDLHAVWSTGERTSDWALLWRRIINDIVLEVAGIQDEREKSNSDGST
jgi:hypothetical protein